MRSIIYVAAAVFFRDITSATPSHAAAFAPNCKNRAVRHDRVIRSPFSAEYSRGFKDSSEFESPMHSRTIEGQTPDQLMPWTGPLDRQQWSDGRLRHADPYAVVHADANELSPSVFREHVDGRTLTVLSNVFWPQPSQSTPPGSEPPAPTPPDVIPGTGPRRTDGSDTAAVAREQWTANLVSRFGSRKVQYQTHDSATGVTTTSVSSFKSFVEIVFESSHALSHFLLDKDLLSELPKDLSADPSTSISSSPSLLSEPLTLPTRLWPCDCSDLFPASMRPKKPCLSVGGAGARSRLHASVWTEWNYCVEGSKLWTFVVPDDDVAQIVEAKRLETTNGDDGKYNSAGWDSDVDLYAHRKRGPGGSFDWPSASALGVMPAVARCQALDHIQNAAARAHPFVPGQSGETGPSGQAHKAVLELVAGNATSGGVGDHGNSDSKSSGSGAASGRRRITVLQTEGQLLLIPPRWWHQTYHVEPSVAIAGQYLTAKNEDDVFNHILEWSGATATENVAEDTKSDAVYYYSGLADEDAANEVAQSGDTGARFERSTKPFDLLWPQGTDGDYDVLDRIHSVLKAALHSRHGPAVGDEPSEASKGGVKQG